MRKKRGLLSLIAFVVILLVVGFFVFWHFNKEVIIGEKECEIDDDCVAASCCHPNSCISKSEAPNCSGIYCTAVCEPKTMDCGQGECKCIKGKCEAVIK